MISILVTGGAGFIGSALCNRLVTLDYHVICLDNFGQSSARVKTIKEQFCHHKNFSIEIGDIRDVAFLRKVFNKYNFDIVIHLAGKGGVRESISNIKEYIDVNVTGSVNVLEEMKIAGVKSLIFASSSSVYGESTSTQSETDPCNQQLSPYATSKKVIEELNYTYYLNFGFKVLNLRFFSVYGENQRNGMLIHEAFKAGYDRKNLPIYGDGHQTRDFTHINDVTQSLVKAIKISLDKNYLYEIINIGSGSPVSVNKLLDMVEQELGFPLNRNYIDVQLGDVINTHACIRKANEKLQCTPETNIKLGVRNFHKWFKKNNGIK